MKSISSIEATQAGIKKAEDSQERRAQGWKDEAYRYLKNYALFFIEFTAEDVRIAAAGILPEPLEPRAWGAVFQRAAKDGLIESNGYVPMKEPHSHRKPTTLWKSKIIL